MDDTVLARNPDPNKDGVTISKAKYDLMRTAIENALRMDEMLTFIDLTNSVRNELSGKFEGSIDWYLVTVKLDMEARGIIERVPGRTQRVRFKKPAA